MGCCSSTATTAKNRDDDTDHAVLNASGGTIHGGSRGKGNATEPPVREPTVSEKRRQAAAAAEKRQTDWRQGGSTDPEKAKALKLRREKDELLGRVYNRYNVLGKEPPIGLPSCDVDQLRRHLESLK